MPDLGDHSRVARAYGAEIVFASSRPTLPLTSTLVLRMRCSRVRRFLSEYPNFDFQLSAFSLPARGVPPPDSRPQSIQHLHLQLFLDSDRNHVVICYLRLSSHSRRTALQAAPLCNLCVLRVSALDFSSLGLTLNLQLSTASLSSLPLLPISVPSVSSVVKTPRHFILP